MWNQTDLWPLGKGHSSTPTSWLWQINWVSESEDQRKVTEGERESAGDQERGGRYQVCQGICVRIIACRDSSGAQQRNGNARHHMSPIVVVNCLSVGANTLPCFAKTVKVHGRKAWRHQGAKQRWEQVLTATSGQKQSLQMKQHNEMWWGTIGWTTEEGEGDDGLAGAVRTNMVLGEGPKAWCGAGEAEEREVVDEKGLTVREGVVADGADASAALTTGRWLITSEFRRGPSPRMRLGRWGTWRRWGRWDRRRQRGEVLTMVENGEGTRLDVEVGEARLFDTQEECSQHVDQQGEQSRVGEILRLKWEEGSDGIRMVVINATFEVILHLGVGKWGLEWKMHQGQGHDAGMWNGCVVKNCWGTMNQVQHVLLKQPWSRNQCDEMGSQNEDSNQHDVCRSSTEEKDERETEQETSWRRGVRLEH